MNLFQSTTTVRTFKTYVGRGPVKARAQQAECGKATRAHPSSPLLSSRQRRPKNPQNPGGGGGGGGVVGGGGEMATRVKDVARRSSKKYVDEALYRRLFRRGSTPQAVREEVDGFLDSRKRAFKWEVGVCVRRLRKQALYRPALKVRPRSVRHSCVVARSDHAGSMKLFEMFMR